MVKDKLFIKQLFFKIIIKVKIRITTFDTKGSIFLYIVINKFTIL